MLRSTRRVATTERAGLLDDARRSRRPRRLVGTRGQALVEFALVFPIFIAITIALVEFAFVFNAVLTTDYASRNATLIAAEAGNEVGADCAILSAVESAFGAPVDRTKITQVVIFRADSSGNAYSGGEQNVYSRTGSTTCTFTDGTTTTVPYTATSVGYADTSRCNVLAGCGGTHTELDFIGVKVTYHHDWRTPYRNLFGGATGGMDVTRSNAMRMEPVL